MTKQLHFTLVMPHYTLSSNGVMVLYLLADTLEQLGHRVTLVPMEMKAFIEFKSHYPARYLERFEPDGESVDPGSIAIMPEITPREIVSRLAAKKRVWYLLNRPLLLTGEPIPYAPEDLVVAHSGLISKIYFNLFILREIPELKLDDIGDLAVPKENLILLYFGKSRTTTLPGDVKRLIKRERAGVVSINRHFPKSRVLLFDLLKRARLLVSFDPLTNLNYEATLCGTPCYIVDNYMQLNFSDFNLPLHGIFEDWEKLSHYYKNGVNRERVIHDYKNAIANNRSVIEEFAQLCEDWFNLTDQLGQSKAGRHLLLWQNEQRILIDRLFYEQMGSIDLPSSLHGYVPPPFWIKDRIKNRLERTRKKIIRTWYKHICGIRGADLDEKLKNLL